ncbi:MAG: hypothetical protein ACKOAD_04245, partial [Gammaproteobacteria bacterium]
QDISEFLFQHLMEGLNLNLASDRASLAMKVRAKLNALPHGTFKRLMFNRLNQLIGLQTQPKYSKKYEKYEKYGSKPPFFPEPTVDLKTQSLGAKALQLLTRYHSNWPLDHLNTEAWREDSRLEYRLLIKIINCLKSDQKMIEKAGWSGLHAELSADELKLWQDLYYTDSLFKRMGPQECKQEWQALGLALGKEARMRSVQKLLLKQKSSNLSNEEKQELLGLLASGN